MALVVKDRIKESTTTTGTGTITLGGSADGFQSFSAVGDGNTTYYAVISGNDWEVGLGTYTASGTTLSRDTILESSNSGSAISLSGTSDVFVTYPAEKSAYQGSGEVASEGTVSVPHIEANNGIIAHNSTITSNYTGPSGHNLLSVGPVVVDTGVTVTVPSGQRWLVL